MHSDEAVILSRKCWAFDFVTNVRIVDVGRVSVFLVLGFCFCWKYFRIVNFGIVTVNCITLFSFNQGFVPGIFMYSMLSDSGFPMARRRSFLTPSFSVGLDSRTVFTPKHLAPFHVIFFLVWLLMG